MTSPYYITTPIYYVNDVPHIGHAYTSLACDVLARFKRLDGKEVHFLTGTDEHGQKVEKSAKARGIEPQAFTDEVSAHFRNLTKTMHFTNDDFIRTTDPRHKQGAMAFWDVLVSKGSIYSDRYAGWYSVRDEAYYPESELVDGKAPTGAPVEWVEEESYFFRLSDYEARLLEFYEQHPDFIQPESRYNEVVSFVKSGLKDLSISRTTFSWGIPVPGDEKHVMYVWLDALTNYLTALGYPDQDAVLFKKFWLEAEHSPVHIVGKDILRFHAVYWPAFLMAADLPLPYRIVAHGWWTNEGEKISKSIGNVIDPVGLVEEFGINIVRYFLMREVPFGRDGNFSREHLVLRSNAELANTIGNLAQRSLSMIQKQCEGKVPEPSTFTDEDNALLALVHGKKGEGGIARHRHAIDDFRFDVMLKDIVDICIKANEYIDLQAPWTLKKDHPDRLRTVLYTLAETIRCVGILLQPFIPDAAAQLLDQCAVAESHRKFSALGATSRLVPGTALPEPKGVFPRVEGKAA